MRGRTPVVGRLVSIFGLTDIEMVKDDDLFRVFGVGDNEASEGLPGKLAKLYFEFLSGRDGFEDCVEGGRCEISLCYHGK